MPNHVHVVVQPLAHHSLSAILHSWKSYTANAINKRLNRTEPLWQVEYFDHLIRDQEDFEHCVEYTLRNPELAGLSEWKWRGFRSAGILPANTEHGQEASSSAGILPANAHGQEARATATIRVRNGAGWEGEIEACWLRPVIKSPRELKTLIVRPEDLRYMVFMPPDEVRHAIDKGQEPPLDKYPHAKGYIEWGEKQEFQENPTCKARKYWWLLETLPENPVLVPQFFRQIPHITYNPLRLPTDHTFYFLTSLYDEDSNILIASILISTLSQIYMDVIGRTNQSGLITFSDQNGNKFSLFFQMLFLLSSRHA